MNNKFHWSIRKVLTLEPKSHLDRKCKTCTSRGGKVGCSLPFRKKKLRVTKLFLIKDNVKEKRTHHWNKDKVL